MIKTHLHSLQQQRLQLLIFILGFSAGLPAALISSTLQAWFTEVGLNLYAIGAVTLLIAPYNLRFLWAPLFDYLHLPNMDRRRSWLFIMQFGLILATFFLAYLTPLQTITLFNYHVPVMLIIGMLISIFAASLEIIINAYQTEILPTEERGLGVSVYVTGWRLASIISGALALVLASIMGWKQTYLIMVSLMSIGVIATFFAPNTPIANTSKRYLADGMINPIKDLLSRFSFKTFGLFFLLILTYKASDALALALNTTFLLREIGFDLQTIGLVNKTISVFAALAGGIFAGIWMKRLPLYSALLLFGVIQGAANLSYALLAYFGKSMLLLITTAFLENFTSGMGTIALMTLIMAMCNTRYTATQIALLSSIAYLSRPFVGPFAAALVEHLGWFNFFICCFLISLPTLIFIYWNQFAINQLQEAR